MHLMHVHYAMMQCMDAPVNIMPTRITLLGSGSICDPVLVVCLNAIIVVEVCVRGTGLDGAEG